jgi:tetratricopeptide (TPR) repeat protein
MNARHLILCVAALLARQVSLQAQEQNSAKTASSSTTSSLTQAIQLAERGDCNKALPILKNAIPHAPAKKLKYEAAMAAARCAMGTNDMATAVQMVILLNREFPHDPEVLYVTNHYYAELASRAAQELAATAPSSYQAHKLNAEALESQGKWDEAEAEYKSIIAKDPRVPDVHYRLGQVLLSKNPPDPENAKKEMQEELRINPDNAAAEFVLGELARRAGNWDDAIQHFSHASKLDVGFSEAFLALGMSLNSAGKFSDAIAPLEQYAKMEPLDPAGHYQLATAYARSGRKQDAVREMDLQRQTAEKQQPPANSQPPQ